MDHFTDRHGVLHAEDLPVPELADAVGTPFYCYSTATIVRHFGVFQQALAGVPDPLIAFAVKANPNIAVLATLARLGAGADVVSGGELARALAAGVPPGRIIFSGVGKTADELRAALAAGIHQINIESAQELDDLARVAAETGARPAVAFRVNPDVDAGTHAKISTGRAENKFGIAMHDAPALYARAAASPHLQPVGIAAHIGSQLTTLEPLEATFARMRTLVDALRAAGHTVSRVDLGGGLGIPYDRSHPEPPTPAAYGALVARAWAGIDARLAFEPGRLIVGNAGILVSRVVTVKRGATRTFVILDAAMNDLLRPTLYGAFHAIRAVAPRPGTAVATFAGPVCETGDEFAADRETTPLEPGDLVAILTAGAYGATMASEYNTRPLVPELLVHGGRFAVVRPRRTIADIIAQERPAPWLQAEEPA